MSGEYVPMAQRTPEQQEAYRASCRIRNARYYERKKSGSKAIVALVDHAGVVPCLECGEDMVPVCGFCKDGLAHN